MTQPLQLAFIVNLYPPYIVGGNEILARDVIEALRQRGHTVHVLTGRGPALPQDGFTHQVLDLDFERKQDLFFGGLPLTLPRLFAWHLYNRRSAQGVTTALRAIHPDLVIAWNLYMASAAPLVAAQRLPYPVIAQPADKWLLYMLHDIRQLVPAQTPLQKLALTAIQRSIQPLLRRLARPDYLLTVSEFIRQLHLAAGYSHAQSRSTYLGIPTNKFTQHERPFPGQTPWRLLFVGQLWAGKGPQIAIEAVRHLAEERRAGKLETPPLFLDLFGSGHEDYLRYLTQLVANYGLQEQIKFHGFVDHARLVQEFHSHHLYLFCSLWDEPFSGGLLEAMGTGIPTIATSAGGTPEAVIDGHNGLIVPPNDPVALAAAIRRLQQDPALYAAIGQQGAADVQQRWRFDQYIDRVEALYQAMISAHRQGQALDLHTLALPGAIAPLGTAE